MAERIKKWRAKKASEVLTAKSKEPVFASPQLKGKLLKRTRETLKGTPKQNKNVLKSLLIE